MNVGLIMNARKSSTNRKFYSLPENPNRVSKNKFSGACKKREDIVKLVKYIDDNIIGKNSTFTGPYGRRKVVYCDYAASGRSLQFVEDYIVKEVLPNCGNVHSTTSITSLQSAIFRHEAKEIFRICVNATDDDSVIFAGHGCRGAVCKLLQEVNFEEPPIVFVGPCERQSALLPWKDLGAKVIRISESKEGFLDLDDLETQLLAHKGCGAKLIGCFSAANSITGILADDVATTLLLHQHGALAFWDYSTAAPYVQLDMNPTLPGVEESAVRKDVMFFSGHKFIGGVQTPGVLIAKKFLFKNSVPKACSLMNEEKESPVTDIDFHDDRGTATIAEDVRAGLVMHLKESVGAPAIMTREEKITRTVLSHVKNIPEFILLGNNSHSLKRLPFFSFMVRHPRGMFLHHNFVCSILNDIFGIQARAGCASPGSYSQDFMGIDTKLADDYEKIIFSHFSGVGSDSQEPGAHASCEILRPGFSRISLPFCISDTELGFILEALKMVATEGWKLLPQYTLKPETGEWRHHSNSIFRDRKWLGSLRYIDGKLVIPERKVSTQGTCPADYEECLHVARCIFNRARKMAQRYPLTAQKYTFDKEAESLRWFMLPSEAHDLLIGNSQNVKLRIPFNPISYRGCKGDPLEVNRTHSAERKLNRMERVISSPVEPKPPPVIQWESECEVKNNLSAPRSYTNVTQAMHNSYVPNLPQYMAPERQNSFSSEISNSDQVDSLTFQQTQCYPNLTGYVTGASQIPTTNEVYCYSPQPTMPSPLTNQMDYNSQQFFGHQHNYLHPHQKNYANSYNINGLYDNTLYQDQSGVKPVSGYGMNDRLKGNGKTDTHQMVNKVHFLLGGGDSSTRQRCNSLGSSLIGHPRSRGGASGFSCRSLTDGETSLNLSECSLSSNEDIHAYVTEVTKELATEIKSEIREVISKVEDVLSESADADNSNAYQSTEGRSARCPDLKFEKLERTNSLPSASANDIAQYLMGVSKEMAEEMKSEIRGLVSSVVSPESSPMLNKKGKKVTIEPESKGRKDFKVRKSNGSTLNGENISHSRDSGINLSYSETSADSKAKEKETPDGRCETDKSNESLDGKRDRSESFDSFQENERTLRCRSESLDSLQENEDSDAVGRSQIPRRKISRASKKMEKCFMKNRLSGESSNDEGMSTEEGAKPRWYCPSKAVWKPTVEALKEFEMIKNGDKILVCLSGGKNSLAILHTLQQYRFYASSRGIHFELGAVTLYPNCTKAEAKPLISYLEGLGVPYHYDEQCTEDSSSICNLCWKMKRSRLYAIARERHYNVIALGQNLDDLAESFLMSAFHNGRLRSMKAHYYVTDKDIRVIRPFVYVREKALRQFVETRNLPEVPENCLVCKTTSKERQRSKQMLSHQESAFPRLFSSLKAALHPLISFRYTGEEGRLYKYATDSDETSLP